MSSTIKFITRSGAVGYVIKWWLSIWLLAYIKRMIARKGQN